MSIIIKCGNINIKCVSTNEAIINSLQVRFAPFVTTEKAQLEIEIDETDVVDDLCDSIDNKRYLYFTMFDNMLSALVNRKSLMGSISIQSNFVSTDVNNKYDAIDVALSLIAAQFLPFYGTLLLHGSCIVHNGSAYCFIGLSNQGKTTISKIFSSECNVLAEDMFEIGYCEDILYAMPIPFAQKEFWCDASSLRVPIANIFVVKKGELSVTEIQGKSRFQEFIAHQLFRSNNDDVIANQYLMLISNKILKSVKLYNLTYDPVRFYSKDREYITELKSKIFPVSGLLSNNSNFDESLVLNDSIAIRRCEHYNRWELWESRSGMLFGINQVCKDIIDLLTQCRTRQQLQKELPNTSKEELEQIISSMLSSNIIINKNK
ncbi:MAG TPA: hypothetical protein DHW61_03930 [Lachnoclostridium phytofermentans]|uniref:HPr kinase n=1 Tax=Lachnoclostridium phytofermentans TaxID=66219 RepID=A0A3D2X4S5_9FIRM|nr:hypothetical protein [Lachnoclostridium sp.]HCL01555.1 hypothetical protein [Lachnoclostridium phytofermentans]